MTELEQSRTKLVDQLDLVQKKAFTKWVNSHLAKAGIEIADLFQDLRDGSILLLLLELFTGTKLKRERGKMKVHHLQNVQNAKSYLTDVKKIKIVGIPAEEIVAGNKKLTLGLIWMLILNFELSGSLPSEDKRPTSPHQVSAKAIKEELLQWSQKATDGYEEVKKTTNFHKSWRNGMAFCAIINRHRPDLLDIDDCNPDKPLENLEKAFSVAEKELGVIRFLDPEDVNVEKPSEEAVLMYVSALKQAFPDMPPPHRKKGPSISPEEYTSAYNVLGQWIQGRMDTAGGTRALPTSVSEVRGLLEGFQRLRGSEDVLRGEEKERVRGMAAEIRVFEMKNKQEFNVPDIKDLEKAWSDCLNASDAYEDRLKQELVRLEELESLVGQIQSECSSLELRLESIGLEVGLFESEGGANVEEGEVKEVQGKLKSAKASIEKLEGDIQLLREGHHPSWTHWDETVSGFWKTHSSLRSRLDSCITSVSDIQTLLAEADTKLKMCELWLLEHGRFSDNQLIVEQKGDYETFGSTVLAAANEVMNNVNSVGVAAGHQEEVRDLNKRWDQVKEQLKNRIDNLSEISNTVTQFDTVRGSLQEWCVNQQETYGVLPLLETDPMQLTKQRETFQSMLSEVLTYQEAVVQLEDLSIEFLKHKEPIQTFADKYARRLKRVSRNFAAVSIKSPSEADEVQVSLFEQSEILRTEWERNKTQVQQRLAQADDLLSRLAEFMRNHTHLVELIKEGEELLEQEHPVGSSAHRIEQQTQTCQEFRTRLSETQPAVDSMLALGRSIIGEFYTNPDKDTLSQTLTQFISNWSNLLLSWQNWYDELHATGEQSRNLTDQFMELKQVYQDLEPKNKELLPAVVTVETLESDLKNLKDEFSRDVVGPVVSLRGHSESLALNVHLLTDREGVERTLTAYSVLLSRVEKQQDELNSLVNSVTSWWTDCSNVTSKVAEMREDLCDQLPLAGSLPCINGQDEHLQSSLLCVEELKPKVSRAIKHLTNLCNHESLIQCRPIVIYRDELQQHWKELYEQVETRRDVVEVGRVRLNVYTENRDPFDEWLKGVESQLGRWRDVDSVSKEQLLDLTEGLRVFKTEVEMHSHEMDTCEVMANKYIDTAKKCQSALLAYRRKLHPDATTSHLLPEQFYDWETEGLSGGMLPSANEGGVAALHDPTYQNGLVTVSADITRERKRFNRLKGRVSRRCGRFTEARDRRMAFHDAIEAVLPQLEETELLLSRLQGEAELVSSGGGKNLKEQLELMENLETQFSTLRSLMDPLHLAAAAWAVKEPIDSEDEGAESVGEATTDLCASQNTAVQERYSVIERAMRNMRETLESSLAEAQAFQSSFSSFASWLRDAERKVQKDDPLKLEVMDLRSGLAYLKAVGSDISGHAHPYEELRKKFQVAIDVAKSEQKKELQEKLDNLESRWTTMQQLITEDVEAIQVTRESLDSFNGAHLKIFKRFEELCNKLTLFSPSAITSTEVDKKKAEFEELLALFNSCHGDFESLLQQYDDLFNTPFDQTKFNQSIDNLKGQIKECKKLKDDKNRSLKHIVARIKTLEMNWTEFESWLTIAEDKMEGLDQSLVTGATSVTDHLKQAQSLQEDVADHEAAMDSIESLVSSLAPYLERHHMDALETRYNNLFIRYRCLHYSSELFPVQVWLHNRSLELVAMEPCAVAVAILQSQVQEVKKYQTQLEGYSQRVTQAKGLLLSLPPHSDLTTPETKLSLIETHYTKLKRVCVLRGEVLSNTLPRLKLYENSLDNWETSLRGWEESVGRLAPPTTAVLIIQSTTQNIKALQGVISNQEPEFYSLMREARQMCAGSEEYRLLLEKLKTLCPPHYTLEQPEAKPGQLQLQERLDNDQKRLDNLKKKLSTLLTTLNTLNERTNQFTRLHNQLLPWLQQQLSNAEELKVTQLSHQTLNDQLRKLQVVKGDMKMKAGLKEELVEACTVLSSCLSSDSEDVHSLRERVEEVSSNWSDLTDRLATAQSSLEPCVKQAKSYEGSQEKLQGFMKSVLSELAGLTPIPSEPEAVQEMKSRTDELKSEYNELIPVLRKCVEDGGRLQAHCTSSIDSEELGTALTDLENKWNSVGTMLNDIHQKLTETLVETQEFQQVADSLDRWVNATQTSLKRLEPVAVRVQLIEPQIEGLKPVIEDISINRATLDQVKVIGEHLLAEATTEERLKIGKKLHSLEMRFYGLDKTTKTRMTDLQEALTKAKEFEGNCSELSDWLTALEGRLSHMLVTPVRSQPLKTLTTSAGEFNEEVISRGPLVADVTLSETALFDTDTDTIRKYELQENFIDYLSSPGHSRGPSPYHAPSPTPGEDSTHLDTISTTSPTHPGFLDRPGSRDVLENGAVLRNRYKRLQFTSDRKREELNTLLTTVLQYEARHDEFNKWLDETLARISGRGPLAMSHDQLKAGLDEATSIQQDVTQHEPALEWIDTTGTSLMEACKDELSSDSLRESLSQLNDKWSTLCQTLDNTTDRSKKGMSLTDKYIAMERAFDSWLSETEAKLDRPVSVTGSPTEMQQIVRKLENIQSDIDSHKIKLDSLVVLGQELETFVLSNTDTVAASSLVLGYHDCDTRYQQLLSTLDHKRRGVSDDVLKASELKSHLSSLLNKLNSLKSQLDNHEPPQLLPDPVTEQLTALEALDTEHASLDREVTGLSGVADTFHLEDGSELFNLHSQVCALNDAISDSLKQWRDKLNKAHKSAVQFDKNYKALSTWIRELQAVLVEDEGIRATVEGMEEQMKTLQDHVDTISAHSQQLQDLMDRGRSMMTGASPENCLLVGDRLAQIQSAYESLQRHGLGKMQSLRDSFKRVKEFNDNHSAIMEELTRYELDLAMLPPVGADIDTVRDQIEEFKETESDVADMKAKVSSCQSKGKHIKDVCHHDDRNKVDTKLEELNAKWIRLQSAYNMRQQDLENALLRLGQFREALQELIGWIRDCTRKLGQSSHPGIDLERLEQQLNDMKALQSEIVSRDPSVASLNEASKKLTAQEDASTQDILKEMTELNTEWQGLKSLAADRQLLLSTAHERGRVFASNLKTVMKQFNNAEDKTSNEWRPHSLPHTCQQDLDSHQKLCQLVEGLKEPLTNIRAEAEALKPQATQGDIQTLTTLTDDLEDRWQRLLTITEDKQSQLEAAKDSADTFDQRMVCLAGKLAGLEDQIEASSAIHSEAEEVKGQLKEHKELLGLLEQFEEEMGQAEGMGGALVKQCVSEDGKVIKKQLADLRSRYDQLQSRALDRLSSLEEALLTVGRLEEAYQELSSWLGQAWDRLQTLDPIPSQSEGVATLYAKHKVFQKELGARSSSHASVIKAGKELMKSKQGEDKSVLKGKMADLEHEWTNVCQMSTAYQHKLENALKMLRQFESQAQPIKSWMTNVLPTLDQSQPLDGDIETVHELAVAHEAFQNELGGHQKSIDTLISLGDSILSDVVEEQSPLREEVEDIREKWASVCNLSVSKQDRLLRAQKNALQFQQNVGALWSWMEQKEVEIDLMAPPTDEEAELQQQILQHTMFEDSVLKQQPYHDKVINEGRGLMESAHPRAEPVLSGQLQQLEHKWKQLRGKISSRSEALTSSLIEITGLQDSIDELSEWVGVAENEMGVAEGLPIGDEPEGVELQLNQHESFQEEMAKHQPKMEALNKASKRRKSRVSLQHGSAASPEISRKIGSLDKRWKRLWLRSNERHRQLLEARTRLKDIALARSFNFDAWCKKFVSWVDQQKLRVSDLFRRFDSNHDGMLTREEFMKGLKASGLAINQIEMEKIADAFDRNKSGLIDLAEMTAILKGQKGRKQFKSTASAKPVSDSEKIDMEIQQQVSKCCCEHQYQVVPVKTGQYKFGDSQKLRMVRILRSNVMVRVGGGWEPLDTFLTKNDPCRISGRTNTEITPIIGTTQVKFRSKTQSVLSSRGEEARRVADRDPASKRTSRAPHSGRQETVLTKKLSVPAVKTPGRESPSGLRRTYTGTNLTPSHKPTTSLTAAATRKTSSLGRFMSPPREGHTHPVTRPKTPSGYSTITTTDSATPTRPKTPSRNGGSTVPGLTRPPSRGSGVPRAVTPSGSRIPVTSRIPTPRTTKPSQK